MAKRPNLGQITSSVFTVSQLNAAYDKIDTAFDNTLSRDGSTPNTMLADLDMNSNDILNIGTIDGNQLNVNEAYIGGKLFTGTLTWRSDWATSTSYQELDLVKINGNVYVALEEHTSNVFATDLSGGKWELFVENATGPEGPAGDTGATGPAGEGVPVGGTTGQVLAKIDGTDYNTEWVDQTGGGGGVTDHGALTGLSDDDHTQYHNDTRGDARYYTQSQIDTALSGKAATSHTHTASEITDFDTEVANNAAVTANTAKVTNATHTGDVTGSTALTIANDAVSNAKLANMATASIKGRVTAGTGDPEDLTATQAWSVIDDAALNTAQNFTKAQGSTPVSLTDGANIATDASLSNVFTVTLGGNRTLDNPTNVVAGRTYVWVITQDGSGGHTLAYDTAFDFPGGTAPTLSTGASDVDIITGIAISTSRILCVANLDFS